MEDKKELPFSKNELVEKIIDLRSEGKTLNAIAEQIGVSRPYISKIIKEEGLTKAINTKALKEHRGKVTKLLDHYNNEINNPILDELRTKRKVEKVYQYKYNKDGSPITEINEEGKEVQSRQLVSKKVTEEMTSKIEAISKLLALPEDPTIKANEKEIPTIIIRRTRVLEDDPYPTD